MVWEFKTKSQTYLEFAEEAASAISETASRKVHSTVRVCIDAVIDLQKVLGEITEEELMKIYEVLIYDNSSYC
jgi:hypothetical protein